jgi:hypothetical protein
LSAHGLSCSRRLSPLSGRNSTYRPVQISGAGSLVHMLIIDRVPGARDSLINAVAFSLTASVPLIAIELYLDSWRQRFFRPPGRPPSDTTRETMSATPAIAT